MLKPTALTLSLLLAIAGCGGSSTKPLDHAHLARLNLVLTDLPADYTGATDTDPDDDATESARISRCVGVRDTHPDQVADARSLKFTSGPESVKSEVSSYRDQDDITADQRTLRSPKLHDCQIADAKAETTGQLPAGAVLTTLTFAATPKPVPTLPNVISKTSGVIGITYRGQRIFVYEVTYDIVGRELEASLDFEENGSAVSDETQLQLLTIFAKRVAKA